MSRQLLVERNDVDKLPCGREVSCIERPLKKGGERPAQHACSHFKEQGRDLVSSCGLVDVEALKEAEDVLFSDFELTEFEERRHRGFVGFTDSAWPWGQVT